MIFKQFCQIFVTKKAVQLEHSYDKYTLAELMYIRSCSFNIDSKRQPWDIMETCAPGIIENLFVTFG